MIAFLFRAILAVVVFGLAMSAARALGRWIQHRGRRAGPAPRPEPHRAAKPPQRVNVPPEEVIDVSYRPVPPDEPPQES